MRVVGHALQYKGRPVLLWTCCGSDGQRNYYHQIGHGLCSCREMSPCLDTTAERQRWHRAHKALTIGESPLTQADVDRHKARGAKMRARVMGPPENNDQEVKP